MLTQHFLAKQTITATGTIAQGQPVGVDGAVASAGAQIAGVAMFGAVSGDEVAVCYAGIVEMTASASITAGAELEVAASGKVVTLSTGKKIGVAMSTAGGDGVKLLVKLS